MLFAWAIPSADGFELMVAFNYIAHSQCRCQVKCAERVGDAEEKLLIFIRCKEPANRATAKFLEQETPGDGHTSKNARNANVPNSKFWTPSASVDRNHPQKAHFSPSLSAMILRRFVVRLPFNGWWKIKNDAIDFEKWFPLWPSTGIWLDKIESDVRHQSSLR